MSLKKLIAIALKWKKMAGIGRRRILLPRVRTKLASRGHFVVYSTDKRRFVVPLAYLHTNIFRELFRISEEEFGLPGDGPIVLPCDAAFLEYVVCIVKRPLSKTIERAMLLSLVSSKLNDECSITACSCCF